MTRRRSQAVIATGTAIFAAAAITACGTDPKPDYQAICADQHTQQRIPDEKCDDDQPGTSHVYYPIGSRYPGIGDNVHQFTAGRTRIPAGHTASLGGTTTRSGTITRGSIGHSISKGGFGVSGHGHGSVGG